MTIYLARANNAEIISICVCMCVCVTDSLLYTLCFDFCFT